MVQTFEVTSTFDKHNILRICASANYTQNGLLNSAIITVCFLLISPYTTEHTKESRCQAPSRTSCWINLASDVIIFHLIVHYGNLEAMFMSRDSVVRIATGYWLDDQGVGIRVSVGSRIFSSPRCPDRLWGSPNILSNGYRGLFPRG
jgi:hypothetical protein